MPNAVPAMLRKALQAGECRSNDEVRMSNRCNFCWLHSVDSVRFSAFSASSAVQKGKAAQQRSTQKRFAQSVTSV
jgi:hypothetical protein